MTDRYANRRPWTDVERRTLSWLRRDCGLSYPQIAAAMGRSLYAVKSQAYLEGIAGSGAKNSDQPWLPCEDQFLIDNWHAMNRIQLSARLGREPNAITNRRRRLRLPPKNPCKQRVSA